MKIMPKHDIEDNHTISNDSNNNHCGLSSASAAGLRQNKSASSLALADTNNPSTVDTSRKDQDSPCLRIALADKPAAAISSSMLVTNPLLTASLNSPPVNLSANGSVDLSSHANHRQQRPSLPPEANGDRNNAGSPDQSSTCSKEMYANLLMQLRHQGITTASTEATEVVCQTGTKMSAAARKEKLKSQLCFSCPVCKKRFQRHIAMNAHFQAEHLGSTPAASGSADKICKLCAFVGQDMSAIRNHLFNKHNIDLETPTACLVEPEYARSSSSSPAAAAAGGSGNGSRSATSSPLPSSSSDKKSVKNTSVAVSIIRTSIVPKSTSVSANAILEDTNAASSSTSSHPCELRTSPPVAVAAAGANFNDNYLMKQNDNLDIVEEEAKDLSIKKPIMTKRCAASPGLDLVQNNRKRLKTGSGSQRIPVMSSAPNSPLNQDHTPLSSQAAAAASMASTTTTTVASNLTSQWQCQHCNIIFPDQTLYFLHRGFHSNSTNPWKCNGCGQRCNDMYDFNTHLMSDVHH